MSKLTIKNNINSELSITHADNKPAKSIIASDIAVAVDTINDFPLDASDGDTVIVRDLNRGGTFIYDSSKVAEHNEGTNFNGWVRQYDGAVNVKWFGAVGDGRDEVTILNNISSIKDSIDLNGLSISTTALTNNIFKCLSIENGSIISLESMTDNLIRFDSVRSIKNVTFDGGGFSIGSDGTSCSGKYAPGMIFVSSKYVEVSNCNFSNLNGEQGLHQYGLVIEFSTQSIVKNSQFTSITTKTNSAANGGFCGGLFYLNTDINKSYNDVISAAHKVYNTRFIDIYTKQNDAGGFYSDSDGIRSYINSDNITDSLALTAIENSVISIDNCYFLNVLKSACKVSDCKVSISNCSVITDDLKSEGQTEVYAGFRYQNGGHFSLENCRISGAYRIGAIAGGLYSNRVNGLVFASSFTDGVAVYAGASNGIIDRIYTNNIQSTARLFFLNTVRNFTIRDSYSSFSRGMYNLAEVYWNTDFGAYGTKLIQLINCKSDDGILAPYSNQLDVTVDKIEIIDCDLKSTINTNFCNLITSTLSIQNSSIESVKSLYSSSKLESLKINNSEIKHTVSDSSTTLFPIDSMDINISNTSIDIQKCNIIFDLTSCNSFYVDNLKVNINVSDGSTVFYSTDTGSNVKISNVDMKAINSDFFNIYNISTIPTNITSNVSDVTLWIKGADVTTKVGVDSGYLLAPNKNYGSATVVVDNVYDIS